MVENLFKTNIKYSFIPNSLFEYVENMTSECEEALADDAFMLKLKNLNLDVVIVNR